MNSFKVIARHDTMLKTNNKPRWIKNEVFWCVKVEDTLDDYYPFDWYVCVEPSDYVTTFVMWYVTEDKLFQDFITLAEWRDNQINQILEDDC